MKICALLAALAALSCTSATYAQVIPAETVVAKVDGKDVTAGDLRQLLETAPPALVQAFHANAQLAIQDVYVLKFLAAEGERQKLAEQSPWKEQIEQARMNTIATAMVNQARDGYQVSPEETETYYNSNLSKYQKAKIKVIYIGFKPTMPTGTSPDDIKAAAKAALEGAHDLNKRSEAEARVLAVDIVKKIREGADFVKLVDQYSEDPTSKAVAGDFGTVKADSPFPEDIKKAVAALKPGEVSEPVRQGNAFYIIRVEEKSTQTLNEVREPINQTLRQEYLGKYLTELRQRFAPKIEKPEFFLQLNAGKP